MCRHTVLWTVCYYDMCVINILYYEMCRYRWLWTVLYYEMCILNHTYLWYVCYEMCMEGSMCILWNVHKHFISEMCVLWNVCRHFIIKKAYQTFHNEMCAHFIVKFSLQIYCGRSCLIYNILASSSKYLVLVDNLKWVA